ncbi:MAG: DUF3168 domain-containing protein [Neomegalonema sp.]|nr:DUF3168 domain-containing protein [Neomegalonema sp.]
MTAALSWPLQQALYARLAADEALSSLLPGPALVDSPPHDARDHLRPPYILLGDESIAPLADQTHLGARHRFSLTIHSAAPGFAEAKRIAAALSDALIRRPLALTRGTCIRLDFISGQTRRLDTEQRRELTLTFEAALEDS